MSTMTRDQLMEAAACEAVGANTPVDSAAYERELAGADDRAKRSDRELRATVARMSAISPYIEAPAQLRGRLLQATAPTTFKMEDYRKATQDGGRFYRWGFYAAMLFLMAGAYYNLALQSKLKQAGQFITAQAAQVSERDAALTAFVNPNVTQIHLTDEQKNRFGEALVDEKTHTAVVILPGNMVPANQTVRFSMPNSNVAYNTILVRAPDNSLQTAGAKVLETNVRIKTMEPDAHVPQNATLY